MNPTTSQSDWNGFDVRCLGLTQTFVDAARIGSVWPTRFFRILAPKCHNLPKTEILKIFEMWLASGGAS